MARNRKLLLKESEIRRFLKLANIAPIGGKRMNEMGYNPPGARDDEELDVDATEMDLGGEDVETVDAELEVPAPAEPLPMDEPLDDMGDSGMMVSVDQFMDALESALEDVTGEEVETEVDLAGDEEIDIDAEDPEGGDPLGGPEAEPVPDAGVEMDLDVADENALQEKMVNRVAARVAKRLQRESRRNRKVNRVSNRVSNRVTERLIKKNRAAKRNEKMVNEVTERIFKRLTQKK